MYHHIFIQYNEKVYCCICRSPPLQIVLEKCTDMAGFTSKLCSVTDHSKREMKQSKRTHDQLPLKINPLLKNNEISNVQITNTIHTNTAHNSNERNQWGKKLTWKRKGGELSRNGTSVLLIRQTFVPLHFRRWWIGTEFSKTILSNNFHFF